MVTTDVITVFVRKRAKTTSAWRETKSQRCWKTLFHPKSKCVCVSVCLCWCVTDGATHHSVCSEQTAAVGAYGLPTLWLLGETLYFATKVISSVFFCDNTPGPQCCSSSLTRWARWRQAQWPCQPSCVQEREAQRASRWALCLRPSSTSPVGRCTEDTCLHW